MRPAWVIRRLCSRLPRQPFLTGQLAHIDPEVVLLIVAHPAGPALLAEPGVGPVVAAQMLISWSHPGRVRSESAFASLARSRTS